jgi:predicted transcriptional regulator
MNGEGNILYLFLQKRFLECSDQEGNVDYSKMKWKIINTRFPQSFIPRILKEMEDMGLLQRTSCMNFKIINKERCNEVIAFLDGGEING